MERLVLNGLGSDPSLLKYSTQGRKGGKLSFLEKCPVLYEVLWSLCMENLNLDEQEAKSQMQMFFKKVLTWPKTGKQKEEAD